MPDDLNIDAGLEPPAPTPRPRRPPPTTPHLDVLTDFARQNNLTVGSTTGGRHNLGSRHYSGNAMDIRGSGGFDDATVGRLSQLASQRGLKLRDERVRPKGQAVWGGPHLHVEYMGQQVSQKQQKTADPLNLDSGLDLDAGLGSQGRATPRTKPQQPIGDVVSALQKVTDDVNRRMAAIPKPALQQGNIDLTNRPRVRNPDGSTSTVRSMSVNIDGREVLLPTVSEDGRIMSNREAVGQYKRTGKHLGVFANAKDADAYAKQLHEDQAKLIAQPASQPNPRNLIDKRIPNMVDALTQPTRQPTFEEDRAQRLAEQAALKRASTPAPVPQMTQVLSEARNAPDVLLKDQIREQVRREQPAPLRTPWNPQSGPKDEDEIARITDERFEAAKRARDPEMTAIRKEYGQMGGAARTVAQPLARVGGGILKQVGGVTSALGIAPNAVSEWANVRGQMVEEGSQLAPLDAQGEEIVRGVPEKVVQGLADLGLGIGQIVLLKKATGLPFNQLMALESALKTSDQPVGERAKAATEAYALGTALDTHLGRGTSAALFGGPTAIQSAGQVARGQMSPEDALIQTGVQAGAGAVLGGRRAPRDLEARLKNAETHADNTTTTPAGENRVVSTPEQPVNRPEGSTANPQGLPAGEGNAQANQPTPRRWQYTDFGEVSESPNQRRVGKGRVRVTDAEGVDHVIRRAALTGAGNQRAIPLKETTEQRSFDNTPMTPDELARAESELNLSAGVEPSAAKVDILGEQPALTGREVRIPADRLAEYQKATEGTSWRVVDPKLDATTGTYVARLEPVGGEVAAQPAPTLQTPAPNVKETPQVDISAEKPKAARSYDEIQSAIDARETELEQQGVDVIHLYESPEDWTKMGVDPPDNWKQMPSDLVALYRERNAVGSRELQQNIDELSARLRSTGLTDSEAKAVLDEVSIKGTDAFSQSIAADSAQRIAAKSPRELTEMLYMRLAMERDVDTRVIDTIEDIGHYGESGLLRDAASAARAVKSYFNGEPLPDQPTLPPKLAEQKRSLQSEPSPGLKDLRSQLATRYPGYSKADVDKMSASEIQSLLTEPKPNSLVPKPKSPQVLAKRYGELWDESIQIGNQVFDAKRNGLTPKQVAELTARNGELQEPASQIEEELRVQGYKVSPMGELAKLDEPFTGNVNRDERESSVSKPTPEPSPSTTSARKAQMGEPRLTSAKDASMQADRERLGLPPLEQVAPEKSQQWLDEASARNASDPRAPDVLVEQALQGDKNFTDVETMQVNLRAVEVSNRIEQLNKEIAEATDPQVIRDKSAEQDVLLNEYERISRADDLAGAEWSRAGTARQQALKDDFSLAPMVAKIKKDFAKRGETAPPELIQEVKDLRAKITTAEAERDAANERVAEAELQKQVSRVSRQRVRAETKQTLDDEFAQLSQQFRAKMTGVQPLGIDPTLIPVIGKMARNRIKAGITDAAQLVDDIHAAVSAHLPDVTKRDIRDAISGYGLEGQGDKRSDAAKQLADIRTELRNLSKGEDVATGTRLSRQDAARQKQLQKQEAELTSRMASRNFDKPARVKPVYTRETYAAEKRVRQLKADYEKMRYRATRGIAGKLADTAVGVGNVPKTLLSMGDLSALLRQGGVGVIQHPILSGRAAHDMLRSFTEHGFANVEQAIKDAKDSSGRSLYELATKSGLEFTGIDRDSPKLTHREEGYLGSNVIDTMAQGRANPLRVVKDVKDFSERTFVSFLDSQRMRILEQQSQALRDMGLTGKDLDAALKSQAKYINIITGRGSLGTEGNKLAPALNLAMFSPRLVASRFQLLNKMFNPAAWARMPKGARRLQMVDNVKFLGGAAAALGLARAAGAQVNLDPDDADFLKIKVGNTRFDTLAGLQQPLRFAIRMAKAVKGGETYSGDTKGDIFADFMRSKASPEVGLGWDYLAGSNRLSGKRFEPLKDTARTLIPLPAQDFYEAIKEDGKLRGTIEAIPSLLGVGVQTYKGAAEKPTTPAEKLARRFVIRKMGGGGDEGRTQGEIDTDTAKSELRARVRRGEDISADIAALKSKITERQIKAILGSRNKTRLQEDIDRGGPREAILVYSVATPAQKAEIKDIVQKKSAAIDVMLPDDAAKVRAMYEAQGFQRGPLPRERAPRQPRAERKSQPEGYLAP